MTCFGQEMTDIMHSIYDMMGKYTYPCMRDSAPQDHVECFFQVGKKTLKYGTNIGGVVQRSALYLRLVALHINQDAERSFSC